MKHTTLRNALVTLGSFIFVVGIVTAWTGPSTNPPDGNADAPVNLSNNGQIKVGALQVAALVSLGGVKMGTTTASCTGGPTGTSGTVRWYKGVMEYCDGTTWVPFGGGGGGDNLGNQIADTTTGLNMSNTTIFNLKDPTGAQDAATKAYVDSKTSVLPSGSIVAGCGVQCFGMGSGMGSCSYTCWGGAANGGCPGGTTKQNIGSFTDDSLTPETKTAVMCIKN